MLMNQYDEVMTIEQFMDYLSIGKNTAYKILNSGQIKSFKIGRVHKIPKISVDEYIQFMRTRHT